MKRPRVLFFVVAWGFIGMLLQASYLTRPAKAYGVANEQIPPLWFYLPLVAFGFAVWQTVGLARLKRFHRWFAVVFFAWWAIALVWNATVTLGRPNVKLVPALLLFSAFVTLNLLSAWYLSRRSFREFAVQFVAQREKERHSRMMQKICQKKMREERGA